MVKRAQIRLGIIAFLMLLGIGVFIYALLAPYISSQADDAINNINLSPTEQFFLSSINVWIILCFLIAVLVFGAFMFSGGSA